MPLRHLRYHATTTATACSLAERIRGDLESAVWLLVDQPPAPVARVGRPPSGRSCCTAPPAACAIYSGSLICAQGLDRAGELKH